MNYIGLLAIIINCVVTATGFIHNNIKLRSNKVINMCNNNNFGDCQYITEIVPIVPNKTKVSYIANNINYEIVVSIYTTYNNKNNLMFLNNGSYVEIYNRTIVYDNDKLQQTNIVSQTFYNRIIEYLYKTRNVTEITDNYNTSSKRLYK